MTDHQHTADVLNRAADLIEQRGWTQGVDGWDDASSPLCLEGALAAAIGLGRDDMVGQGFWSCPAHDAVADYLDRNPQPRFCPIADTLWNWNDAEGRTASEVIETLRAAAAIEQAKHDAEQPATVAVGS